MCACVRAYVWHFNCVCVCVWFQLTGYRMSRFWFCSLWWFLRSLYSIYSFLFRIFGLQQTDDNDHHWNGSHFVCTHKGKYVPKHCSNMCWHDYWIQYRRESILPTCNLHSIDEQSLSHWNINAIWFFTVFFFIYLFPLLEFNEWELHSKNIEKHIH